MTSLESHVPDDGLIRDPAQVAAIAQEITLHGSMCFDIEFVSEGRLIPELSLLQVSWGRVDSPHVAAIDFLAVGLGGIAPIFELIGRADIETVAHSARQDLGLLAVRYGVSASTFWDTQIAAAFVGMGEQMSYARLVQELAGARIDKAQQFTAWLTRPLSPEQLRYALDDVRYLPRVWAALRYRLGDLGRLSWVREESARLAACVGPLGPPEEAYKDIKGWRSLSGPALGSLRALAAWRQRQAVAENKPYSWIVSDRAMLDLCRTGASEARALRAVRGVGEGTVRRYGKDMLEALSAGAGAPPPDTLEPVKSALSSRGQVWASILTNLIQARCMDASIAPRFIAARSDAEALADWFDRGDRSCEPPIDLLKGWRRELAGEDALAWLRGDSAIAASMTNTAIELRAVPGARKSDDF